MVTVHTAANVFNSTSAPTFTMNLLNASGTVTSQTVTLNETATEQATDSVGGVNNAATFSTTGGALNQGQSVTFTVQVAGVNNAAVAGTVETYTLSGSAVTSGQVTSPSSGTVTLGDNGTATVTVNTAADVFSSSSGHDTLTFTLNTGGTAATDTVTVNNGTVNISTAGANEGSPVTFSISTTNLPTSTVETYTLTGNGVNQVNPALQSGTVTITGGTATLIIPTSATLFNQLNPASETLVLTLGGPTGGTSTATIAENATISVSAPGSETGHNSVSEGNSVTFTLAASSNVPAGTQVAYTLSGDAIGNVAVSDQTGTATVNPGGTVTITVPTLANDNSGVIKDLTITLNNLNNLAADPTVATALINENAANVYVLTTGTDLFTGNPTPDGGPIVNLYHGQDAIPVGNTFFATQATLGQSDVLTGATAPAGTTDVLYLTTSAYGPAYISGPAIISGFSTAYIPVFDIGANDYFGTFIDMSSASLVHQIIYDNSSGSLTLKNVGGVNNVGGVSGQVLDGANGFGGIVIQNPSQIFAPNEVLTVGYTAPLIQQLNNPNGPTNGYTQFDLLTGQTVSMFNSLGPVTGIPSVGLTIPGVLDVTIATMPNSPQDGLTFLNWAGGPTGLQDVTLTGPAGSDSPFVFGDGPGFTQVVGESLSPGSRGYIPLDFNQTSNYFELDHFRGHRLRPRRRRSIANPGRGLARQRRRWLGHLLLLYRKHDHLAWRRRSGFDLHGARHGRHGLLVFRRDGVLCHHR